MRIPPKVSQPVRVVSDTKTKAVGHPLLGRVVAPEAGSSRPVLGRIVGGTKGAEGHVLGRVVIPGHTAAPGTHFLGRVVPHSEVPKGTPVLGRIVDPDNRHAPAVIMGRVVNPDGKPAPAGGFIYGRIAHPKHEGPIMGRIIAPK